MLALIAFTGYGPCIKSAFMSSPELTTNGMLVKCWRRIDGKIYLYKAETNGFANSGLEPYSEYYASQIAKTYMGKNQIEKIKRLINFKFKKHSKYNLSDKRLRLIEKFIQIRIQELLK